jgi:folate-binding protein YgfZ
MDFLAQYNALSNAAGFALLPGRTILSVAGTDRTQFLQSFTTNDIKKLTPGCGCEAFVTNTHGKTLGHVMVFCEADYFLLDSSPNQAATLIEHFNRYVITEDVVFTDRTVDLHDILLAGPKAAGVLKSVSSGEIHAYPVEFAGPLAFFIQAAPAAIPAVTETLATAGAIPCEADSVECARLEAGTPLFGIDITADNLPQEVGRDRQAISFTKGCYLGQETVARIDAVGHVNRLLVGLKFLGPQIPVSGTILHANEKDVGHVTSAAWSPRLNAPLALGYVRRNFSKPGTKLSSSGGDVEVVTLPLTG